MQSKLDQLREVLCGYGSVVVAYSGGVDSTFLAKVARDALGERMLAVIADSPSLPRRELAEAIELGRQLGFAVEVIKTDELRSPDYAANPANRCYFCKHALFERLASLARTRGFAVVAHGENADDAGDYRPGAQAAAEFHVRAPLKDVGLTKAEIRELSAELGLPTATKPQMACLASRIPYGEAVTEEALRMIEAAENVLRDAGFYEVRVRHHTLGASGPVTHGPNPPLARIEVGQAELARLLNDGMRARITEALKQIGYAIVTVDLQGYRRGSLNTAIKSHNTSRG